MKRFIKTAAFCITAMMIICLCGSTAFAATINGEQVNGYPTNGKRIPVGDTSYTGWRNWSQVTNSYIVAESDGGFTSVQYDNNDNKVYIQSYSKDFVLTGSHSITPALPIFGGFYSGKDAYYIASGDENHSESNSKEVIRIMKYSKSWKPIGAAALLGANTTVPFDGGTLEMVEIGDYLYVETCHEMYTSDDGLNHQSNLLMKVDTRHMSISESRFDVSNSSTGYCSHSFCQRIATDGESIYTVDHGDAYPRSIFFARYTPDLPVSNPDYTADLYDIPGNTGNNFTGVELGDIALSSSNILVGINSMHKGGSTEHYDACILISPRNEASNNNSGWKFFNDYDYYYDDNNNNIVFFPGSGTSIKGAASARQIWLTDYPASSKIFCTAPVISKINDNKFLVMWEERVQNADYSYDVTSKFRLMDGEGTFLSETMSSKAFDISEVRPAVSGNKVTWYSSSYNDIPVFYQLDCTSTETLKKSISSKGSDAVINIDGDKEFIFMPEAKGTVYRLLDNKTGEHLYTTSTLECATLLMAGWIQEPSSGLSAGKKGIGIYRIFNPATQEHLYSSDKNEVKALKANGWSVDNNEKPLFYGAESGGKPVYRLYNPTMPSIASHHYTSDKNEVDTLTANGWQYDNGGKPMYNLK